MLDKIGMKDEPVTYDDLLKLQPELKKYRKINRFTSASLLFLPMVNIPYPSI